MKGPVEWNGKNTFYCYDVFTDLLGDVRVRHEIYQIVNGVYRRMDALETLYFLSDSERVIVPALASCHFAQWIFLTDDLSHQRHSSEVHHAHVNDGERISRDHDGIVARHVTYVKYKYL